MKENLWLIWSLEHNGWWMPDRNGYHADIKKAGRYTFEEAREIVTDANNYNSVNEAMCPVPRWV